MANLGGAEAYRLGEGYHFVRGLEIKGHYGVDWGTWQVDGVPVPAAADGVVCWSDNRTPGFGPAIALQHTGQDGIVFESFYGHVYGRTDLPVGSLIKAGEIIGYLAPLYVIKPYAPTASGPHVHFEVITGVRVNPITGYIIGPASLPRHREDALTFTGWGGLPVHVGRDTNGGYVTSQTISTEYGMMTTTITSTTTLGHA